MKELFDALNVSPAANTGGYVLGVGVDLMRRNSIFPPYLHDGDPFVRATYSVREQEEAARHGNSYAFYETRFCGKEAVFKSLGISGERVRFCEIEILGDDNGRPTVTLLGGLKQLAAGKGIDEIQLSLTYDGEYTAAVAVAQEIYPF